MSGPSSDYFHFPESFIEDCRRLRPEDGELWHRIGHGDLKSVVRHLSTLRLDLTPLQRKGLLLAMPGGDGREFIDGLTQGHQEHQDLLEEAIKLLEAQLAATPAPPDSDNAADS